MAANWVNWKTYSFGKVAEQEQGSYRDPIYEIGLQYDNNYEGSSINNYATRRCRFYLQLSRDVQVKDISKLYEGIYFIWADNDSASTTHVVKIKPYTNYAWRDDAVFHSEEFTLKKPLNSKAYMSGVNCILVSTGNLDEPSDDEVLNRAAKDTSNQYCFYIKTDTLLSNEEDVLNIKPEIIDNGDNTFKIKYCPVASLGTSTTQLNNNSQWYSWGYSAGTSERISPNTDGETDILRLDLGTNTAVTTRTVYAKHEIKVNNEIASISTSKAIKKNPLSVTDPTNVKLEFLGVPEGETCESKVTIKASCDAVTTTPAGYKPSYDFYIYNEEGQGSLIGHNIIDSPSVTKTIALGATYGIKAGDTIYAKVQATIRHTGSLGTNTVATSNSITSNSLILPQPPDYRVTITDLECNKYKISWSAEDYDNNKIKSVKVYSGYDKDNLDLIAEASGATSSEEEFDLYAASTENSKTVYARIVVEDQYGTYESNPNKVIKHYIAPKVTSPKLTISNLEIFNISWNAAAVNTHSVISGYNIEVQRKNGNSYTAVGNISIADSSTTATSFNPENYGLVPGDQVRAVIKAYTTMSDGSTITNIAGSATSTVTVPGEPTASILIEDLHTNQYKVTWSIIDGIDNTVNKDTVVLSASNTTITGADYSTSTESGRTKHTWTKTIDISAATTVTPKAVVTDKYSNTYTFLGNATDVIYYVAPNAVSNIRMSSDSGTTWSGNITYSWSPTTDGNDSSGISGYEADCYYDGTGHALQDGYDPTVFGFWYDVDTSSLAPGKAIVGRVRAFYITPGGKKLYSDYTVSDSFVIPAAPTAPKGPAISINTTKTKDLANPVFQAEWGTAEPQVNAYKVIGYKYAVYKADNTKLIDYIDIVNLNTVTISDLKNVSTNDLIYLSVIAYTHVKVGDKTYVLDGDAAKSSQLTIPGKPTIGIEVTDQGNNKYTVAWSTTSGINNSIESITATSTVAGQTSTYTVTSLTEKEFSLPLDKINVTTASVNAEVTLTLKDKYECEYTKTVTKSISHYAISKPSSLSIRLTSLDKFTIAWSAPAASQNITGYELKLNTGTVIQCSANSYTLNCSDYAGKSISATVRAKIAYGNKTDLWGEYSSASKELIVPIAPKMSQELPWINLNYQKTKKLDNPTFTIYLNTAVEGNSAYPIVGYKYEVYANDNSVPLLSGKTSSNTVDFTKNDINVAIDALDKLRVKECAYTTVTLVGGAKELDSDWVESSTFLVPKAPKKYDISIKDNKDNTYTVSWKVESGDNNTIAIEDVKYYVGLTEYSVGSLEGSAEYSLSPELDASVKSQTIDVQLKVEDDHSFKYEATATASVNHYAVGIPDLPTLTRNGDSVTIVWNEPAHGYSDVSGYILNIHVTDENGNSKLDDEIENASSPYYLDISKWRDYGINIEASVKAMVLDGGGGEIWSEYSVPSTRYVDPLIKAPYFSAGATVTLTVNDDGSILANWTAATPANSASKSIKYEVRVRKSSSSEWLLQNIIASTSISYQYSELASKNIKVGDVIELSVQAFVEDEDGTKLTSTNSISTNGTVKADWVDLADGNGNTKSCGFTKVSATSYDTIALKVWLQFKPGSSTPTHMLVRFKCARYNSSVTGEIYEPIYAVFPKNALMGHSDGLIECIKGRTSGKWNESNSSGFYVEKDAFENLILPSTWYIINGQNVTNTDGTFKNDYDTVDELISKLTSTYLSNRYWTYGSNNLSPLANSPKATKATPAETPVITDNGDNTFTITYNRAKAGSYNPIKSESFLWGYDEDCNENAEVTKTETTATTNSITLTIETPRDTARTVYAKYIGLPTYYGTDQNESTFTTESTSAAVKQYILPSAPGEPVISIVDATSGTNFKFKVTWGAATAAHESYPIEGYTYDVTNNNKSILGYGYTTTENGRTELTTDFIQCKANDKIVIKVKAFTKNDASGTVVFGPESATTEFVVPGDPDLTISTSDLGDNTYTISFEITKGYGNPTLNYAIDMYNAEEARWENIRSQNINKPEITETNDGRIHATGSTQPIPIPSYVNATEATVDIGARIRIANYCNTNYGDDSLGLCFEKSYEGEMKNYQAPGTPDNIQGKYRSGTVTVDWEATKTNDSSPIKGYKVNFYKLDSLEDTNGILQLGRDYAENSISVSLEELGLKMGDFLGIQVFAYTVNGKNEELCEEQGIYYAMKISGGIMRVMYNGSWKEGQVWVCVKDANNKLVWKEAEGVYVKTATGWKESI